MTENDTQLPAEPGAGADKLVRSNRWFSKDLELTLFAPKEDKVNIPPKPPRLYIPLLFSKDLELTFFAPKEEKVNKPFKPLRLVIPMFRPQAALGIGMIVVGLLVGYNFGLASSRPEINIPANSAPVGPAANPVTEVELVPDGPARLARSAPTRVRIPAIGVKASMVELDKKADGTIQIPKRFDTVGWYKRAPTPGEIGPAIMVGHVDNVYGPAVFYRLKELKAGDIIQVDRADGSKVKFKVTSLQQFSQARNSFPTDKVYGNIEHAGLRLITCSGTFNRITGAYSHNTVVFASVVR